MSEIFAYLPPSRTHEEPGSRFFRLVPSRNHDGYLTIQQGKEGPKGGRSKISVESYSIEEVEPDPDEPFPGRAFLLGKDSATGDVYEVWIPREGVAVCSCEGFHYTKVCKHCDVFVYLCFVEKWCADDLRPFKVPAAPVDEPHEQGQPGGG